MTDSVFVNNNRCVSPFKLLSPFSLASSTWQSRWTSSDRLTTSTQKCTSSSTCRPESWSRATTNLFWTTGQPSRRSKGETFITSFLLKNFFFLLCFCFFTNFVFTGFYFFCAGLQKQWSYCRCRWRSCSIRWRSWSWVPFHLRNLHTERAGLAALTACAACRSCKTHSGG